MRIKRNSAGNISVFIFLASDRSSLNMNEDNFSQAGVTLIANVDCDLPSVCYIYMICTFLYKIRDYCLHFMYYKIYNGE